MKTTALMLFSLLVATPALGAIHTEAVDYKDGDVQLQGYLAYDDALTGKRPGVLVVHEWWGLGPYVKMRAEMLAKQGYVAFAPDMYGKGLYSHDHQQAGKWAGAFQKDRAMMRKRALAGLAVLQGQKNVDPSKIVAMGYCFGGTAALELARAGADLKGVVTFHAGLETPNPDQTPHLKAKILINQGADDTYTRGGLPALEEELKKAGAEYQINIYSGAVHGFTVKEAGNNPASGMAYNAEADLRSWQALQSFLAEVFQ